MSNPKFKLPPFKKKTKKFHCLICNVELTEQDLEFCDTCNFMLSGRTISMNKSKKIQREENIILNQKMEKYNQKSTYNSDTKSKPEDKQPIKPTTHLTQKPKTKPKKKSKKHSGLQNFF